MADDAGLFHRAFERWARRVRARLVARRVLTGAAVGILAGGALAAGLWWLREGSLRPWAAVLGLAGAVAGLVYAMRRRWSDSDVALYLDARLEADEAISTAVELRSEAERPDPARAVVVEQAASALDGGDPKKARPKILAPVHALFPVGVAAVVWLSLMALPALPPPPPVGPGAEIVQVDDLKGLEKIEALEKLDGRDAAQKERLKKIANDAKKLREELAKGMQKREALSELARMRDAIAAERLNFGDKKNRQGLEAAIGKLGENDKLKKAADALGDGDLTEFDAEMKKLASQAEKEDRDAAKKALEEAAKAAREKGADDVAKALEEQKELFERREAKAEALRKLAKELDGHLSDEAKRDLEEFGESGDPEAQKRLSDALNEALEGLSEEEQQRLAERMKEQLEGADGQASPMTKQQLEDMAKQLETPEGRKRLAEMLKEMAKDESDSSKQQQGLDDAERGGAEAQKGLGAVPIPMEGSGSPNPGSGKGPGEGQGNDGKNPHQDGKGPGGDGQDGQGGPGGDSDKGKGSHEGSTDRVEGSELRAKANPRLDKSVPMLGATKGRGASRPGETANQKGVGALGKAGKAEVGGVERSEVPEEYREQVGRYFQP